MVQAPLKQEARLWQCPFALEVPASLDGWGSLRTKTELVPLWKAVIVAHLLRSCFPSGWLTMTSNGPPCVGGWSLKHTLPPVCTGVRCPQLADLCSEMGASREQATPDSAVGSLFRSWGIVALTDSMGLGHQTL